MEDASFWFAHRNKVIARAIQKYLPAGTLLDIGGGNGYVAQYLLAQGIETALLEPGYQGCRNARARGIKNVCAGTLEAVQEPLRGSVPAVGLFDVVEHVEDDQAFLTGVHTLLQPNGYAYITVPALPFLWSKEDVSAGHYRRYTRRTLESALTAAGFSVVESQYFFQWLVPAVFISRVIGGLLGQRNSSHDHKPNGVAAYLCQREMKKIQKGKQYSFGTSIWCVAKKL